MNTNQSRARTRVSVRKLAARTVLATALGTAVIGLTTGVADAAPTQPGIPGQPVPALPTPIKIAPPAVINGWGHNPIPLAPTISAPGRVVQGLPLTVTFDNWSPGAVQLFVDSPSGIPFGPAHVAAPPPGSSYTESFTWPINSPAGGYHELYAQQSTGTQTVSAQTRVWVDYAPQ